jgi:hypothetical protein
VAAVFFANMYSLLITAWHFCGVAIIFIVKQTTLARPQEMLVIASAYLIEPDFFFG